MQSLQNQEDYNLKDPKRGEKNQEKEKKATLNKRKKKSEIHLFDLQPKKERKWNIRENI